MNSIIILAVSLLILFSERSSGQSNTVQPSTIHNVQVLISLPTNNLTAERLQILHCTIINTSTNEVVYFSTDPAHDFDVSLTDATGKIHTVVSNSAFGPGRRIVHELAHGKSVKCEIPIRLNDDIKSGSYSLKAVVYMISADGGYQPISNPLEVQVSK